MKRLDYIGIALERLMDDDSTQLKVWIPELSPFTEDSPLDIATVISESTNLAPDGKPSATVTAVSYVTCEYYGNTNISRPNVHPGEQIKVHMVGDNHEYYWDVIGRSDYLRTTEHVKLVIANKPNQLDELDETTSYYLEMDTREGQRNIHIRTSKGTGEAVEYDIKLNLDDSTLRCLDSVGNFSELISLEQKFHTENALGDFIEIVPNKITSKLSTGDHCVITPNTINISINNGDTIVMTPDKIVSQISNGDSILTTPNNIKLQTASGDSTTINAGRITHNAPLTYFTGKIVAEGTITDSVSGANVTVSTHKHPGTGSHYDVNKTSPMSGT